MNANKDLTTAERFAKFVVNTRYKDIDPGVIDTLKKLTLKQVLGMLVGSITPATAKLLPYAMYNRGRPESGVFGCGFKADIAQAALINGFSSHTSEMEDDQFPGGGISDVTVWPALLSVAEKQKLSGKEVLTALYVGQEMQNRMAWWASSGTDQIGILNLPFIGIYGATAACAKALKLSEAETKASFGLAMVTGLGYVYEMGTDAHYWESAMVCRNAVVNALMAKSGFTSAPEIEIYMDRLTGGDGKIEFKKMTEGLGEAPFYTNNTWIKRWGFCFSTHVYVDILSSLMQTVKFKPEDVEKIAVQFDPNRKLILDRPVPTSVDDSRFSIQHILAYQLLYGHCSENTCSPEALADLRIIEARKKVHVVPQADAPTLITAGDGRLEVKLKDGSRHQGRLEEPYGGPLRPLTIDQVVGIYHEYTKDLLSDTLIERSSQIIIGMEAMQDLAELFDICTFRCKTANRFRKLAAHG